MMTYYRIWRVRTMPTLSTQACLLEMSQQRLIFLNCGYSPFLTMMTRLQKLVKTLHKNIKIKINGL
jgi:hypothetical protein